VTKQINPYYTLNKKKSTLRPVCSSILKCRQFLNNIFVQSDEHIFFSNMQLVPI